MLRSAVSDSLWGRASMKFSPGDIAYWVTSGPVMYHLINDFHSLKNVEKFDWDESGVPIGDAGYITVYAKINHPVLVKKGPTSVLKQGRYVPCYLVMFQQQDILVEEHYLAAEPFEGYMRDFLGAQA